MGKIGIMALLNNKSKPKIPQEQSLQVEQIKIDQLLPNESNFYDTSDIEDLKASIQMFGIMQPLLVKKIDKQQYRVIAGHRRLKSAQQLYAAGYDKLEYIPCVVEPESADSIREKLLLIYTNSTTRELSDWEKLEQLKQLKELLTEFKKTHELPGRMRDLLAESLNVSPSAVGRMETVDKNLEPEFKQELKHKNISMQTAVEISKHTPEKQKEILKEHRKRGNKTKAKHIEHIKSEPDPEPEDLMSDSSLFDDEFELRFLYREALSKTVSNVDNRLKLCAANYQEQPDQHNQNKMKAYELVKQLLENELKNMEG